MTGVLPEVCLSGGNCFVASSAAIPDITSLEILDGCTKVGVM